MFFIRLIKLTRITLALVISGVMSTISSASGTERAAVDFVQIKNYADFSEASYQGKSRVDEVGQSKQHYLIYHGYIPELSVTYYLLRSDKDKSQVVVVRGTSNIENTLLNMDVKLVTDAHAGIRLHRGFSLAAEKIYRKIKPQLKPDYTVSVTGHSLGGAVALILAMYLDLDQFDVTQVVTFGQPKVTNIAGAARFGHLNILRVVAPNDLVPLVPPLDPVDINDLDIYWHIGMEVILLPDNRYAILDSTDSMLRVFGFTKQLPSESNLQNHQMGYYLSLVESKLPVARRESFKLDLNLFNLFNLFDDAPQDGHAME
ncbi:lipase family protein [Thiohalophilus sp.]|uniref:lipase family protein n=1 Tax=Thiohalophilus sp. TaxID=3028392 RepID=UPI002ACD5D1F|nr:lipase family protein [Thiohalophilus sp.]MDZ7661119.1 lipase family protein [Thiohalophilus sp.]MDZ7803230.1 lipase family protein [Thiohalophilus sp.]